LKIRTTIACFTVLIIFSGLKEFSDLALELARIYHDRTEIAAKSKHNLISHRIFQNIQKNSNRQREMAIKLISSLKVQTDIPSYGIEFLPLVQDFYDKVERFK
jgi:hypothetical protein